MNRAEHMEWSRQRALAELDAPGAPPARRVANALASIHSDLRKHPDTAQHQGLELGAQLTYHGHLQTVAQVREWIGGLL